MEKRKNKPTDEREKKSTGREPGKHTGPLGTSVEWEIPGDAPEKHRQSISPYSPVSRPDTKKNRNDISARSGGAPFVDEDRHSRRQASTGKEHHRGSVYSLRGLIVLFLVLGLGGVAYMFSGNSHQTPLAANAGQEGMPGTATIEDVPTMMRTVLGDVAEQSLKLPQQVSPPEVMDNTQPAADAVTAPRIITHVVKKGDTLWDIAEQYIDDPFRYPELAELSEIDDPDLIYPGDVVRIRV